MTVDMDTDRDAGAGPAGTTGLGGGRPDVGRPGVRLRAASLLIDAAERLTAGQGAAPDGVDDHGGRGGHGRAGGGSGGWRLRRRWSRRKVIALVAVVLLVLVVAVAAFAAAVNSSSNYATPGYAQTEPYVLPDGSSGGALPPGDASTGGDSTSESAQRSAAGIAPRPSPASPDGSVAGTEPGAPAPGGAARPEGVQPRIVRTGSAVLEVQPGQVDVAVTKLSTTATGLGGYTSAGESTGTPSTTDDSAQYASVTLRVPTEKFDEMRGQLSDIGTVTSSTLSSQDVTGEYEDLEARKRALEASRNTYLALLAEAQSVGDTLSVQQQIDIIQVQIEQIEGKRQVLADSSDLATLTVQVVEEGEAVTRPDPEPSGLTGAFERAWNGFADGLEEIIAATGPVALAVLMAGLIYGAYRAVRGARRRRRAALPPPAVSAASASAVTPASHPTPASHSAPASPVAPPAAAGATPSAAPASPSSASAPAGSSSAAQPPAAPSAPPGTAGD